MNVGSQVAALSTKFTINGQTKQGSVQGEVVLRTTRKVVVQSGDNMYQITPANFGKNFDEVSDMDISKQVEDIVRAKVNVQPDNVKMVEDAVRLINKKQTDNSSSEKVQTKADDTIKVQKVQTKNTDNKISRKDQVAEQINLGVVGATAIAKVIGMNASYCQRLVGQINKARDTK